MCQGELVSPGPVLPLLYQKFSSEIHIILATVVLCNTMQLRSVLPSSQIAKKAFITVDLNL